MFVIFRFYFIKKKKFIKKKYLDSIGIYYFVDFVKAMTFENFS